MPETSPTYRAIVRAATAAVPLFARFSPKLGAGDRARRNAAAGFYEWARLHRDPTRPLVWFHSSSVGEGLQAESVIDALRRIRPVCQFVYTHFSPSAEPLARRLSVDASGYLPYDLPRDVGALLEALRPDLLVFSKLDLWPELATRAANRGVTVAMVAGTVSAGSGRLRWPARQLLAPGYASIAAAAAIAEADAARLVRLGVPASAIRVLGDPRFDSAAARVRSTDAGRSPSSLRPGCAHPCGGFHLARRRGDAPRCVLSDQRGPTGCPAHRRPARTDAGASGRSRCARLAGKVVPAGAAEPGDRSCSLSCRGPARRAGDPVRWGRDGVRRRRIRPGGSALGSGTGCLGSSSSVRSALAAQPRC